MAEHIIIDGFNEGVLDQIAYYLGTSKESISSSIRTGSVSTSSDNDADVYQKKMDELAKKEKELIYYRDLSKKNLADSLDKLAKMGKAYEELTTSEKRQYTIIQNKIKATTSYLEKTVEGIKNIQNETAALEEQLKTLKEIKETKEKTPESTSEKRKKYRYELQDKRNQLDDYLWERNEKEIKDKDSFELELQKKRKENEYDLWKSKSPIIKDQEQFQLELQKKRKENELDLWESKGPIIKNQEEFQLEQQKKRREKELDFFELNKDKIQNQEDYQFEQQQKRKQAELDFFKSKKTEIQDQEDYQFEQQQKRKQAELDSWKDREDKIKELDKLETSLLKKRNIIADAKKSGQLVKEKWEQKGYDSKGRETTLLPMYSAIGKFKARQKTMSLTKRINDDIDKVGDKTAQGLNFIRSDKQLSLTDVGNKAADVAKMIPGFGGALSGIIKALTAALELYDKINSASSKYARSVGGGITKMKQMKYEAVGIADRISEWHGKAYKFDKILEHTAALSEKTGRVMDHMSYADFKSLEDLTQWGISGDVINQLDTFGLSVETIDKRIKEIYNSSGKHGLNAKAVTDAVTKNLQMAQRYTFAGGLRALERMAEKSVALKYNMESVARFADKVSTLEGAAMAGAQLSVLGGNFARMGNPLSLLYGGLQDGERLNDMMLNMTKNLAHWDTENGEIRMSAYNRMRLKAAAENIGVSFDDLYNQSVMQTKHDMINEQLDSTDFDSDERQYIQNLAQLDEHGKAYIRFTGSEEPTYLENMSKGQRAQLKKESEMMEDKKNAKIGDVLVQTRTITEKLNDFVDTFKSKFMKVFLNLAGMWFDGNEKYAKGMGLTKGNAEFFDDFIDEYSEGAGFDDERSQTRLKEIYEKLGMEEDAQYRRIINGELHKEELKGYIATLMNQLQDEQNLTYVGNKAFENGVNNSLSDTGKWVEIKKEDKKSHGGEIRGAGTAMSDSIPAMLSDGEFVVNAKAAQEHLPELQAWNEDKVHHYSNGTQPDETVSIKAVEDQTKPMQVNPVESSIMGIGGMSIEPLTVNPITINVTGTINLTGGGESKSLDIAKIIDDNTFISSLTRKLEETINRRFNASETSSHMPYYIQPMFMA